MKKDPSYDDQTYKAVGYLRALEKSNKISSHAAKSIINILGKTIKKEKEEILKNDAVISKTGERLE